MSLSTETDPKKVAARLRALQPTEKTSLCHHCGKVDGQNGVTLKACSNCKSVKYCSKTCQSEAWRGHKTTCKKLVPPKAESRGKKGATEVVRLLHAAADAGDEGNYDQQICMIKKLLKSNPDQFGAWLELGMAQINTGSWKKAFKSFTCFLNGILSTDERKMSFCESNKKGSEVGGQGLRGPANVGVLKIHQYIQQVQHFGFSRNPTKNNSS